VKRHDTDWAALIAGALALALGAGYLAGRAFDLDVERRGAVAGLLVLAGLLGLAATAATARRHKERNSETPTDADTPEPVPSGEQAD
jgi:hypothetical protein